jgi:hypothetical protein
VSRSLIVIYLQKIFKPFNVFFTPQRFQLKWRSEGIRWGEGLHESREVDRGCPLTAAFEIGDRNDHPCSVIWSKANILCDLAPSSLLSLKGSLGTLDERMASSFHQPRISGR